MYMYMLIYLFSPRYMVRAQVYFMGDVCSLVTKLPKFLMCNYMNASLINIKQCCDLHTITYIL